MTNKEIVGSEGSGSKWHIIYPQYINSNLTLYMGRRLPKDVCVSDPKCTEIKDVLESMDCFQVVYEPNKCYSREVDKEVHRGYVKYSLIQSPKTQDIISTNRFDHKKQVLIYLTKLIPKLKSRSKPNLPQTSAQPQQNTTQNNPKKKKNKK